MDIPYIATATKAPVVLKTPKSLKTSCFIQVEMAGEFTDEGTETHFAIGSQPAYVRAVSSGNKRSGILHRRGNRDALCNRFSTGICSCRQLGEQAFWDPSQTREQRRTLQSVLNRHMFVPSARGTS